MIGLGSNRLSVCRRGGMSVTQAGKGGMEWLAGGRMPRWSSPYSAQATAALLAQFPTQWPTIRDYGFSHPALVPFINEDPMLVCSLMELGKIRWIKGDRASWINSGILATRDTIIEDYVILKNDTTNNRVLFGAGGWNQDPHFLIYEYENGRVGSAQLGGSNFTGLSLSYDTEYLLRTGFTIGVYVNDTRKVSPTSASMSTQAPIGIFATLNPNGTKNDGASSCWRRKFVIRQSDVVKEFVPFISQNEGVGMLNITDLVFRNNIGTGTFGIELIETS